MIRALRGSPGANSVRYPPLQSKDLHTETSQSRPAHGRNNLDLSGISMGMMSHGNAKKIWVILTRATMAVTLSASGSAEDAGTRSVAGGGMTGHSGGSLPS